MKKRKNEKTGSDCIAIFLTERIKLADPLIKTTSRALEIVVKQALRIV
jgi:hypothetical protein